MLKLILGRAGSGKTAHIMEEISRAVREDRRGLVMLIPEQYSHEAERELCRVCGDRLCLCAEVLSFSRLASRVFEELGTAAVKYIDKGGRLLAMSLAVSNVSPMLTVYSSARQSPELQGMLLAAVTELKTARITPESLESAAEIADSSLGGKLRDVALIFEAYNAITSRGSADPVDNLTRLSGQIVESAIGRGGVYIDGFTDFTAQELAVIDELLRRGTDVTVCLTCDGLRDDAEIFDASRRAAFRLLRMAEAHGHKCFTDTLDHEDSEALAPLVFLEKHLFTYSASACEDPHGVITLNVAQSLSAECELAAARTLNLVRERGCKWRDVAIAVRGFEEYQATLEGVFAHYGIPLYSGKKSDLMQKPLPALISGAYEILSGGWEAGDIFAYLKTGLAGISHEDCDILENYVLMWNIRGASLWTREKPWSMHPDGFSAKADELSDARLERINSLRAQVAAPLAALARDGAAGESAMDQVLALDSFLERLGLAGRLEERADELFAREKTALGMEYRQLWDILVGAMEQCSAVLGDMPMTQEAFGRLLRLMLSMYDVGTIPAALDQVSAGDMDRMRRRHIKHLIVLGASDDRLPLVGDDAGIFSDDERELLGELGLELGEGKADSLYRELNLIYNTLTLPSETLTVSYAAGGGAGARHPSLVMHRLCAMSGAAIAPFSVNAVRTSAVKPALELAAGALGGYGSKEGGAALQWFKKRGEYAERLDLLTRALSISRGSLSRRSVSMLYGGRLRLSASRVDAFSSCRFKYFMEYGLRAKPRRTAKFDPPEMGTFMHYVLEGFTREVMQRGGFKTLEPSLRDKLAEKYVDKYISDVLDDFREKSPRFIYLFRRLVRTVKNVVADMSEELSRSDFVPLEFELDFSAMGEVDPIVVSGGDAEVILTGIADRVDGCVIGEKLYLRVVDYKTGRKSFDFTDIWNGMGLQMLMYLFTLGDVGEGRYGREIVPAGVLYTPARDLLVKSDRNISDDEIAAEKSKSLLRSGLILEDEAVINAMENGDEPRFLPVKFKNGVPTGDCLASLERFGELSRYVESTLAELAGELARGSIEADPYFRSSSENACLYCDYYDACLFDESRDSRRHITKLKAPQFWEKLEGGEE